MESSPTQPPIEQSPAPPVINSPNGLASSPVAPTTDSAAPAPPATTTHNGIESSPTAPTTATSSATPTTSPQHGLDASPIAPATESSSTTDPSPSEKPTVPSTSPVKPSDGPTPLPYNLREHKLTITAFWFLIFTETTLIPVIFYFTISRLSDLRPGAMFAIITAMFGFISGGEYGLRGLRLAWNTDEYRPLKGGGRWHFDSTHLILGNPYFVMTALMIGFSIPEPPMIRGLSIIMPVGIIMVVCYMMYTGIAYHFGWRLRWHRLSSHVIGDVTPPLTFCIMEDITGCDGGGGKAYRQAALDRFNESPRFRRMLVQMLWAWSISGLVMSVVLIVLAWTIHEEVAYTLGWAMPSLWGGIGAYATIMWGKRCIRIENEMWAKDMADKMRQG